MRKRRGSGIQLHITSLPSKYGIGDFGPEAYKFADFLYEAGQSYWQVLPLNQVSSKTNYSPYSSLSAFAGNVLLISPQLLCRQGLIAKKDVSNIPVFDPARVDFHKVCSYKTRLLDLAFRNFEVDLNYEKFCRGNKNWLDSYAVFSAKSQNDINREKFLQYVFFQQWFDLKKYCNQRGIKIIGDIPFYVASDSADVWENPDIFKLTKSKKPRFIAGVPPDYYSRTGQLWNNPVYDWKILKKTNYRWWIWRIKHNLTMFDIVRLDHFRGFFAYWQVPAKHKTAVNGRWIKGPGEDFLKELFRHFPKSRFIAEDLGFITADVREAIEKYGLKSTKVLLFAFNENDSANPHRLCGCPKNSVLYTSTHDSNTARGWFEKQANYIQKKKLFEYIGRPVSASQVSRRLIHLAEKTVSDTVIIPMQDILGLGEKGRMNRPATIRGNWRWRLQKGKLTPAIIKNLAELTKTYNRI
ncbi:MAG: 4-alpha-glucanotransferase [Phycisphaerae bacterium]|nr:4-alpha-glucanotransferase [Phycisphaerae bacterium]